MSLFSSRNVEIIRLGIVGCGFMSQAVHLPNFSRAKNCRIVALADKREEVGKKVTRRFGIPKFYSSEFHSSIDHLAQDPEIDAFLVIVPYQINSSICLELISSGKPIFVEKPLAVDAREAEKVISAAAENKVQIMVGYHKRYDPGCRLAREMIARLPEEVGKIIFARVHNFTGDWSPGFSPQQIITNETEKTLPYEEAAPLQVPGFIPEEKRELYFGFLGNFCHDLNLMRFLLGDPKGVKFFSLRKGENIYTSYTTSVFDFGEFETVMETGGIETHLWDEEVKVYFEEGWLELKVAPPLLPQVPSRVTFYQKGKGIAEPVLEWKWAFEEEARHFINGVIKKEEFISPAQDSIKDLYLCESLFKWELANESNSIPSRAV
ncbi:MAG: Gfo/Idh/MocA family oxidoreductase [Candidatus Latescibacteria bacterium]|nr:Gfo/Idh/MocA family oxidoreductase [Candidatus Latescibacterota bacterium]